MAAIPSTRSSIQSSNSREIEIGRSRSGSPFASYGGIRLNSAYDPAREAKRFVDEQNPPREPTICVILGDTLPYLRGALAKRFPTAKLLSLYYDDRFPTINKDTFGAIEITGAWWPSHRFALTSLLGRELAGVDIGELLVLEWPPTAQAFSDVARDVRRTVEDYLRSAAADTVTTAAFHRAWTDNLFTNFLSVPRWYAPPLHGQTTLIAASGPSLARALPFIAENQLSLFILSLPSSLAALRNYGIRPDLIVSVDAGYWARLHFESISWTAAPVAMPLTAARGIWKQAASPVLVSAGSHLEQELFRLAAVSPHTLPDTGTVAAAALELALLLSHGPIIFAGLDLSYEGLSEHVRPHTFDSVLELLSNRTHPLPSIAYHRLHRLGSRRGTNGTSSTQAMSAYGAWFERSAPTGRIYRLFPSATTLAGIEPITPGELEVALSHAPLKSERPALTPISLPSFLRRRLILEKLLKDWETRIGSTTTVLAQELKPLFETLAPRDYLRMIQRSASTNSRARAYRDLLSAAHGEIVRLRDRFLR